MWTVLSLNVSPQDPASVRGSLEHIGVQKQVLLCQVSSLSSFSLGRCVWCERAM